MGRSPTDTICVYSIDKLDKNDRQTVSFAPSHHQLDRGTQMERSVNIASLSVNRLATIIYMVAAVAYISEYPWKIP